jgi:hypothetical protein
MHPQKNKNISSVESWSNSKFKVVADLEIARDFYHSCHCFSWKCMQHIPRTIISTCGQQYVHLSLSHPLLSTKSRNRLKVPHLNWTLGTLNLADVLFMESHFQRRGSRKSSFSIGLVPRASSARKHVILPCTLYGTIGKWKEISPLSRKKKLSEDYFTPNPSLPPHCPPPIHPPSKAHWKGLKWWTYLSLGYQPHLFLIL